MPTKKNTENGYANIKLSLGEISDRYTVLLIKRKYGLEVEDELKKYREFDFGNLDTLYNVNLRMWDIEFEAEKTKDLYRLGKLYQEQRILNKVRVLEKNGITKRSGGEKELKKYT